MDKAILACTALAAACLTGCAGLSADVHAVHGANADAALQGERTFMIARGPSQEASADYSRYAGWVIDELAQHGFVQVTDRAARYVVSIAYDTRPATIGVCVTDSTPDECVHRPDDPFALLGGTVYQHALTLRFFERASGTAVYKVSALDSDHDADEQHAMPALVKSALARFPFDTPPDWRVKMRAEKTGGVPIVISVEPLKQ
jgi:hypothetical protein